MESEWIAEKKLWISCISKFSWILSPEESYTMNSVSEVWKPVTSRSLSLAEVIRGS